MRVPQPVFRLAVTAAAAAAAACAIAAAPAKNAPPAKGAAPPPAKPAAQAAPAKPPSPIAPLPASEIKTVHAAYEAGDCGLCHEKSDPKSPGPITAPVNDLCFSCHEEVQQLMKAEFAHFPATDGCTNCHNPHGARHRKLLIDDTFALCTSCHDYIGEEVKSAKVKHGAVMADAKCANCHNPHASRVEKLLVAFPFDLCLRCHDRDGMRGQEGKTLTNMKAWLDANANWHAPIKAKDCSACHRPHGSENFRLLVAAYPPTFYAPFDRENYALCFRCHNDRLVKERETTTLTGFRNGSKNLHFVHVNKPDRGRTCRACHEVHASQQDHHIREGVPYGQKGWVLKLNYTRTPTGGQCAKTCHETRGYDNRSVAASPAK